MECFCRCRLLRYGHPQHHHHHQYWARWQHEAAAAAEEEAAVINFKLSKSSYFSTIFAVEGLKRSKKAILGPKNHFIANKAILRQKPHVGLS
jgi:hypothetical protein